MNLALYASATGMEAQQLNLNNIANNIANVNTTGFKRQKIEFQDMLYQQERMAGSDVGNGTKLPAGVAMGNGTKVSATAKVFTQGELTQTGRDMDIAIEGNGFFEVERTDGTKAYTRDGALKLTANGEVVTSDGLKVGSGFQNIPTDATSVSVSTNGTVTVGTSAGTTTFRLQMTRFPNPSGLKSTGGNLYSETEGSGSPEVGNPGENGFGTLQQGYLEMSNVNVVEEMVNMIVAQRAYEINSKSIQTADTMLSLISQMKR